ncbi:MAG: two-component system chemotaxis response regulator CheY [Alteromonadaceae bacterium]|jgi:two-component system chemotaxis response regulator CheY
MEIIQLGKKILFVDDSPSMRKVMFDAMTAQNFDVTTAVDGLDGVTKLELSRYDLIISDLNMPNMNGIEFIKKVKEHHENKFAHIIMLTTDSNNEMKNQGKAVGVNVWVVKPFREEQLVAVVNKLLCT